MKKEKMVREEESKYKKMTMMKKAREKEWEGEREVGGGYKVTRVQNRARIGTA